VDGLKGRSRAIQRGFGLLAVWIAAVCFAVLACGAFGARMSIVREVEEMRRTSARQFQDYSSKLAEGERLRNDRDYQIGILKENYGYTRPDETPVIILRETR
jgi:hypothetical protein